MAAAAAAAARDKLLLLPPRCDIHATTTFISYFLPSFILMLLLHSVPLNIIVHVFEHVLFYYFFSFLLSTKLVNLCNGIFLEKERNGLKQTRCYMRRSAKGHTLIL
jgi:hypothetical protein